MKTEQAIALVLMGLALWWLASNQRAEAVDSSIRFPGGEDQAPGIATLSPNGVYVFEPPLTFEDLVLYGH